MSKIKYVFLVVILSVFMLESCNKNSPKEVAYNWLVAFNHLDFETAEKLSTPDTKSLLSALQRLTEKVSDSNKNDLKKVTITMKDVKVTGDKAVATYFSSDNPTKEQTCNLVKQGKTWLVQFSKVDLMGTVPENDYKETSPADTTAPVDGSQDTSMTKTPNQ